jgi:tyrosyl-tRNA synthetase
MYGKAMAVPDNLVEKYFLFATNLPASEIKKLVKEKQPYELKRHLAKTLVSLYHGETKALAADNNFTKQFSKKELPDEIDSARVIPGKYKLSELLVETKLAASKSEARRLIEQNGVKVNQVVSKDEQIEIKAKNNLLLQVGKRKFLKIA